MASKQLIVFPQD